MWKKLFNWLFSDAKPKAQRDDEIEDQCMYCGTVILNSPGSKGYGHCAECADKIAW